VTTRLRVVFALRMAPSMALVGEGIPQPTPTPNNSSILNQHASYMWSLTSRCDFVQFLSFVGGWFCFLPIWGSVAGAGQLMLPVPPATTSLRSEGSADQVVSDEPVDAAFSGA
jgi:hypothetical protein